MRLTDERDCAMMSEISGRFTLHATIESSYGGTEGAKSQNLVEHRYCFMVTCLLGILNWHSPKKRRGGAENIKRVVERAREATFPRGGVGHPS